MEEAKFYSEEAEAPPGVASHYIRTRDNFRLRVAGWKSGDRGTVVIFNGRNEFIEKYGRVASDFVKQGYSVASIDWRSQGLSDRLTKDRMLGHIKRFPDFQTDVQALLSYLGEQDYPRPYHLVAHSMGGLIGLRTVLGDHPFATVTFSSPMWRINFPPALMITAPVIAWFGVLVGWDKRYAPGTGPESYVGKSNFDDNRLTADPETFAWLKRLVALPEIEVGGPSYRWVLEAIKECTALEDAAEPDVPTLIILGDDERVVDPEQIHNVVKRWTHAEFLPVSPCRHEALMEVEPTRQAAMDAILLHFEKAKDQPGIATNASRSA